MQALSNFIGQLNDRVGNMVAYLTTVLVLLFCYDVLMRYLFSISGVWVNEMEWHLFSLIFLLGAAYTFKHDKHVRVDVFYSKFSPKTKAWVNLIGGLLFLVPWCCVLIYASYKYAYQSYTINEGSPNPGGLPYRFLIKFSITLGLFLLLLQGIASIIDSIICIRKNK